MAILKMELDTSDIYKCFDEEGCPTEEVFFTDVIKKIITKEIEKDLQERYSNEVIEKISFAYANKCDEKIISKLESLINEDIVIKDRWGKPKFIGTVEDYIRQEIEEKILKPVNSNGVALQGCTTSSNPDTWIEYTVRSEIEKFTKQHLQKALKTAYQEMEKIIEDTINKFRSETMNEAISKKLQSLGLAILNKGS